MNIEELRYFALSLPNVTEGLPFGEDHLCFFIEGKMFALTDFEHPNFVNLKCDPEYAIDLRERYSGITPGWHMNKKHWISVYFAADVSDALFKELITHSYECVIKKLPKKIRAKYNL